MHLSDFIDALDAPPVSLTVVNVSGTGTEHVAGMFKDLFERQPVEVESVVSAAEAENLVILSRDGERVAASELDAVGDAVLFVNSDLYISGSRELSEIETPAVIEGLTDVPFRAEGYPSTRKEKFLLIEISRFIEARAAQAGGGEIHSGFQSLSRIEDEKGTREVYETLPEHDVETHVYGLGAWSPSSDGLHAHSGNPELGKVWFVAFQPPAGADAEPAALVCVAADTGEWRGFWTFDDDRVADVVDYVTSSYQ